MDLYRCIGQVVLSLPAHKFARISCTIKSLMHALRDTPLSPHSFTFYASSDSILRVAIASHRIWLFLRAIQDTVPLILLGAQHCRCICDLLVTHQLHLWPSSYLFSDQSHSFQTFLKQCSQSRYAAANDGNFELQSSAACKCHGRQQHGNSHC
jgi:hypothetical protein